MRYKDARKAHGNKRAGNVDIHYSAEEEAFRDEVRAFIAENHTAEIKAKTPSP